MNWKSFDDISRVSESEEIVSARNKRQLIGRLIGASIGMAAYALAFRNDGDGTIGLLLSSGLIVGGLPGFSVGALAGILIGALVDLCFGRRQPQEQN